MKKGKVKLGVQNVDGQQVEIRDSCFHEVEDFIANNIHDPAMLSTSVLAERFSYSPSQFSRRFKAVAGKSVKEYVIEAKMEKAKELLRIVNLSIADIAYQLGYTTPFYFTNVFTKQNGISPSAYRKKFSEFSR
ncbi:MAG: helix-turn-helix transcriptional regulator [Lewinellaceae bacterium]|nr:helix-turn-helix transcriptional regulator [Lewinellaceae bacterium]